jgi:hypothetical protein
MSIHDRQESVEEMQTAMTIVNAARSKFQSLSELQAPLSGSMLANEARLASYQPAYIIAGSLRASATDNLERLFELMIDEERSQMNAYPYALYSLIRTSVEAAGTAMWAYAPGTKNARIFRSLQLTYRDVADQYEFAKNIATEESLTGARRAFDSTVSRLNQLKDMIGPLRQNTLSRPPKYTQILASSSSFTKVGSRKVYDLRSPLVIWKIASSFIHGSSHLTRNLSDVRQLAEFENGSASFEMTPSLRVLAISIQTCVDLLSDAVDRNAVLATHDYAGRSVTKP